jgi:hypothetical protein
MVSWDVTLFVLVDKYQHFGERVTFREETSYNLKVEAVDFSETLLHKLQNTWRHIRDDHNKKCKATRCNRPWRPIGL